MQFSFVLLTWNRPQFLERCLAALTASIADHSNCELILLDNGSTDRTPEILAGYRGRPNVRIIARPKNGGLTEYKRLFKAARGNYIVVVDDDVLEFPPALDTLFADYMRVFPDYGYIGLNVVQNEYTNGARPGAEQYVEQSREGRTLLEGPTGGWCACFRRSDYRRLWWKLLFTRFDMRQSEDGFLSANFRKWLSLKSGIIRDAVCFHAAGPYYASQFGHLDREIEKYRGSKLDALADRYAGFRKPDDH
jgi:glycosyltransferase involved in cell wall biosynthesis